jgi:hypothetical protein
MISHSKTYSECLNSLSYSTRIRKTSSGRDQHAIFASRTMRLFCLNHRLCFCLRLSTLSACAAGARASQCIRAPAIADRAVVVACELDEGGDADADTDAQWQAVENWRGDAGKSSHCLIRASRYIVLHAVRSALPPAAVGVVFRAYFAYFSMC